jgi:hypothetical protein
LQDVIEFLKGEDGEWICGYSKCLGICNAYVLTQFSHCMKFGPLIINQMVQIDVVIKSFKTISTYNIDRTTMMQNRVKTVGKSTAGYIFPCKRG